MFQVAWPIWQVNEHTLSGKSFSSMLGMFLNTIVSIITIITFSLVFLISGFMLLFVNDKPIIVMMTKTEMGNTAALDCAFRCLL